MLTVLAPAKVNLTLEVLAKRPDGFHEIRGIAQTINLCDTLHFQLSDSIEFRCADPGWALAESLVSKAADLLQKTVGCTKGAVVEVDKRIPLVSGLSGDSSDAAATLRGLNQLWELGLSPKELLGLATQLGSDVAFFLYGGTALLEGRGEIVTPLPPFPHRWVVLMMPSVPSMPGKTARLYGSVRAEHYTDGQITDKFITHLTGGRGVAPRVFNVFDNVARDSFLGLDKYWQQFLKTGAADVHLAGSGPALFVLVKDKTQAEKIYQHLRQQGLESYLTDTLTTIDYIG